MEQKKSTKASKLISDKSLYSTLNLMESKKTMFIIGNGKVQSDITSMIDKADVVVRFNDTNNYAENTGTKTTFWVISSNKFLINQRISGSQTLGNKKQIAIKEMIGNTQSLLFSIPPFYPVQPETQKNMFKRIVSEDRKERIEAVSNFLQHFESTEHPFRIIEFPNKYIFDIAPEIWAPNWTCPSNGYLITRMFADDATYYKHKKYLVGFSWEGWEGHPWILEKLCLEKMERENLITILR